MTGMLLLYMAYTASLKADATYLAYATITIVLIPRIENDYLIAVAESCSLDPGNNNS